MIQVSLSHIDAVHFCEITTTDEKPNRPLVDDAPAAGASAVLRTAARDQRAGADELGGYRVAAEEE